MDLRLLDGWIPIRIYSQGSQAMVDWCFLGTRRFQSESFFEQTIQSLLWQPFNLLFRHQTPIESLAELQDARPGQPPSGFIFHISRCGSTLTAQMLAALPQNIVITEAPVIDSVLRAKPAASKGKYVKSVALSSTMGPGVRVDLASIEAHA